MSADHTYFGLMSASASLPERMMLRVRKEGRGSVWSPRHFAGLGTPTAIQHALARLARRGELQRIGLGLYLYPEHSRLLGTAPPAPEAVARAAARARGHRIAPTPAAALNRLGLTTQVPGRNVFLTDGPSRSIRAAGMEIELRHASRRRMAGGEALPGLVLRALEGLGPEHVDERALRRLGSALGPAEGARLLRAAEESPAWMRPLARRIAELAA